MSRTLIWSTITDSHFPEGVQGVGHADEGTAAPRILGAS
jgi:hypothetical protein